MKAIFILNKTAKEYFLFQIILFTSFCNLCAQTTQVVKGVVADKHLQTPLAGATIVLLGSNPSLGTTTNEQGEFRLMNVPIGRQSFQISYVGYKKEFVSNIVVIAGKETDLTIGMEEDIFLHATVEVVAKTDLHRPLNELSTVSTRQVSVEETQRFAASINDPLRMATSFAGVTQQGDDNDIVIRGNAPNGLLWRLEGVPIPNPNHFASVGTSGGGISILSAQVLANSDFSTGAFAAEYGNALSGVFDLKLRRGNYDKREYTIGASFIGLDLAAEGPFSKEYNGSYLINYRYSSLGLMQKMGLDIGDGPSIFQDLSFNIALPTNKNGNFTLFGMGGLSEETEEIRDPVRKFNRTAYSNTGVAGLTHSLILGKKTSLKTVFSASGYKISEFQKIQVNNLEPKVIIDDRYIDKKLTLSTVLTHKFNPKWLLRTGTYLTQWAFEIREANARFDSDLVERINESGRAYTTNAFAQLKWQPTERLTFNSGLHFQHLSLNNSVSIEPRMAVSYKLSEKQEMSFAYGLHSQTQPIGTYFAKVVTDNGVQFPNRNLGFTKAHHLVVAHHLVLKDDWHLKTELYYQQLFNVPIHAQQKSTFSVLNVYTGYIVEPLTNKGTGKNYGLELTLEKSLNKGFYLLGAFSLYESKYVGSDNVTRDTRFNANTASALTLGKEWSVGSTKKRTFSIDLKMTQFGGARVFPIDLESSKRLGGTVQKESEGYADQLPGFIRPDIRFYIRRDYEKITSTIFLDIQNFINRKNPVRQVYNPFSNSVGYSYRLGLLPALGWKIQF